MKNIIGWLTTKYNRAQAGNNTSTLSGIAGHAVPLRVRKLVRSEKWERTLCTLVQRHIYKFSLSKMWHGFLIASKSVWRPDIAPLKTSPASFGDRHEQWKEYTMKLDINPYWKKRVLGAPLPIIYKPHHNTAFTMVIRYNHHVKPTLWGIWKSNARTLRLS